MERPGKAELGEMERRKKGLQVLAHMIARVYARDTKLDPEGRIPYCDGEKREAHSTILKSPRKDEA